MNKYVFSFFFLLFPCLLSGQQVQRHVSGRVYGKNGALVDYFGVELYASDTLCLMRGSFIDGAFSLVYKAEPERRYSVKISAAGYNDTTIMIVGESPIECRFSERVYDIEEVQVSAARPTVSLKGNAYSLDVAGSQLSNAATAGEVLNKLPFVMLDTGNRIVIPGKDNVVIYIDKRKVAHSSDLQGLSPADIREVQLLQNPDASYDANADAVILITTKRKDLGQNMLASVSATATMGHCLSYRVNPRWSYSWQRVNLYADYSFSNNAQRDFESSVDENKRTGSISDVRTTTEAKAQNHSYTLGAYFQPSKNHGVSVQLLGWNNHSRPIAPINTDFSSIATKEHIDTRRSTDRRENHYDMSLRYDAKLGDRSALRASVGYVLHDANSNEKIEEQSDSIMANFDYGFAGHSRLMDAQLAYEFKAKHISLQAGAKYAQIQNESNSTLGGGMSDRFTYGYNFEESIPAAFVSVESRLEGLVLSAGLRGERTAFRGALDGVAVIDTNYVNMFPTASCAWSISDKHRLSLSYARRIVRPAFRRISPETRYDNTYTYGQGNPGLLPTITDEVQLLFSASKFRVYVGFRDRKNATIFEYIADAQNPDITVARLANHKRMHFVYAGALYQLRFKKFTSTNSGSFTKPFATVVYGDGVWRYTKPAIYLKSANELKLNKYISFYVDMLYNNLGETLLELKQPMFNLSAGMSLSLLNNKLRINVEANDILDTYNFRDLRYYLDYQVEHTYQPDNTYVRVNLTYSLPTKQRYRAKAGMEGARRL